MREVIVYDYEINPKSGWRTGKKIERGVAFFHQFGVDFEEFEIGAGNYTTAIIEHQDGTVECVEPEQIKFVS